jgi:hypothetical protein
LDGCPSGRDELQHLDLAGTQTVRTDGLCWVQQRLDSMEVEAGAEAKKDCPRRLELQLGSVFVSQ